MESREQEILLVEDNPNDVELTLRALEKNHLANKVRVIEDGAEALEFLLCTGKYADRDGGNDPKVVFLDLKLPKVDGLDVLRAIRRKERTKLLPVVVLTSSAEERDIAESYEIGANSYIVKPIDFENFARAVADLGRYWLLLNKRPLGGLR
jgi:two-component system response regulator